MTVREVVAQAVGRGGATHRKFVGTYDDLVEDFAAWHEDGNVGGFNMMFSEGSAAIREFIDEVVPASSTAASTGTRSRTARCVSGSN